MPSWHDLLFKNTKNPLEKKLALHFNEITMVNIFFSYWPYWELLVLCEGTEVSVLRAPGFVLSQFLKDQVILKE